MVMRLPLACLSLLALAACGAPRQVEEPARSGTVAGGKQTGAWTYRHADGSPAANGAFAGSLQEGPWTVFHPGGAKAAHGEYRAGLRQGAWSFWRPDGSLLSRGDYRDDRQEGPWTTWHADGSTPAAVAWFRRGIWHGPYVAFAADGRRSEAGVYQGGVRMRWFAAGETPPTGSPAGDGPVAIALPGGGERYALADASVTLGADLRLAAVGAPPPPEAPAEGVTSMSVVVPPSEQPPPLPAPVSDIALPPAAADLSPIAVLPGLWTTDQEAKAPRMLARARGDDDASDLYGDVPAGVDRSNRSLHGKPLPQTRFLGGDGAALDLAAWSGKRVVVVVMRGYSGQVCIYCAAQTLALAEAAPRLREQGVETLVVYPGPPSAVPVFLQAVASLGGKPTAIPVALDAGLTLVRGLEIGGNLSLPATFILGPDGAVRWSYIGTSIADRPSIEDLDRALAGIR
jgi:hypothetical protein